MTTRAEITNALIQKILDGSLTQPIKWPNAPFTQPENSVWLMVSIMQGNSDSVTLAETDVITGILQIDIYQPKLSGRNEAYTVANTIENLFTKKLPILVNNDKLWTLSVSAGNGQDEKDWYRHKIEITFKIYLARK